MTKFIILNKADMMTLCLDKPLDICVDGVPNVLCTEKYYLDYTGKNQEPKTGYWEQYGYPWENKVRCSECRKDQPKILCDERIIGQWSNYCPNCGAKMVENERSE